MMNKRILSLVLTLCMVIGMMPSFTLMTYGAETESNWADGINQATDIWDNGGTINTPEELAQFAYNVNNGNTYEGKTIILGEDINLLEHEWTPIGKEYEYAFAGTFDGNNKTITGIQIGSSSAPNKTDQYVGLFGHVSLGEVKNLGVVNVSIYSAYSGTQGAKIGSIVGYNAGKITNSYSESGYVVGALDARCGGLIGSNAYYSSDELYGNSNGEILNSYSSVSVSGGNCTGGLVGDNSASNILNSYSTGNVTGGTDPYESYTGGLVGYVNSGSIANSYATGNVTGGTDVGGLVGLVDESLGSEIINSYSTGDVTGGIYTGGLVGSLLEGKITKGYYNRDANQNGKPKDGKQGVGYGADDGADKIEGRESSSMKAISFVSELNDNISKFEEWELYKWQVKKEDYPILTPPIIIHTTAPIKDAIIVDGYITTPLYTSGPAITWSADGGETYNTASENFVGGTAYKTKYVYTAEAGYEFSSNITVVTLDGGTKSVTLTDSNKTLIIIVTWPPTVPEGIGKTDETKIDLKDGTLIGVAVGQEYQVNGEGEWIKITDTSVENLAPGSYTVRVAETNTHKAGIATEPFIIAPGTEKQDGVAVEEAKIVIVSGTVEVIFNASQEEKIGAVQSYVNGLFKDDPNGVTTIVTHQEGNNYNVTISKGDIDSLIIIAMTINESTDPDIKTVSDVKDAVENEQYPDMTQAQVTDKAVVINQLEEIAKDTAIRVTDSAINLMINEVLYTNPVAGTADNPEGIDGRYTFSITVEKGVQTQTTTQNAITITATSFEGITNAQATTAAKELIVGDTIDIKFGATQQEKTSAVQEYVEELLAKDTTGITGGVTVIVIHESKTGDYLVTITKGIITETKTIEMRIDEFQDPDLATVNTAKIAAENASYLELAQVEVTSEIIIENALKAIVIAAVNDKSVTITINKVSYTAPTAGTAENSTGTNGRYQFTVSLSKGIQTATTVRTDITLYAKQKQIIFDINGNVVNEENENITSGIVKLISGSRQIAQEDIQRDGKFTITGIPSGTYNLVISKDDQTITLVITVSDNNIALGSVILPNGRNNKTDKEPTIQKESSIKKESTIKESTIKIEPTEEGAIPQDKKGYNPFKDINKNNWFFSTVLEAYEIGLMVGTSEDEFSPYAGTTRGMIATMLYRLEGEPTNSQATEINDVKSDKWYAEGIAWAKRKGLIVGYEDGTFKPDQNVTRQEMCVILERYAIYKGYDVSKKNSLLDFTDYEDVSSWAVNSVKWTVGNDIIKGKEKKRLDPKGIALRAEVCAMVLSFMDSFK